MSVNDPHNEFNNLVARYISGELAPREQDRFREILDSEPELRSRLEEYRKIWESMDQVGVQRSYDLDNEWNMLSRKIWGGRTRSLLFYTYRIAAALLVGLLFAFAWIWAGRVSGTELVVTGSEPAEVFLDDGSHILVNRDSRIRYRKEFRGSERRVRLSGEAWFDVAKDSLRPFVIDARTAYIEVLGTSFNVNAYKESRSVEITVESGIVSLTARQDQHEQIILMAGNSGTYNHQSRELVLVPDSDPNNISWKTRDLYFDNTPLAEVAELVRKVYNVSLEIMNPELAACPITVTFMDQDLESVLNVLQLTLDLEIKKSGNRFLVDGAGCVE